MTAVNAQTCKYCFLDFDIDHYRKKLATGAAFVHSTNSRYGFSSKDLRSLGGSELSRIKDLISTDHEWASRDKECGGIEIRPPPANDRIVIELFWDVAPLACENFATLCSSGSDTEKIPIGESGKFLMYKNSVIHRVIPGFIMQGGDFVFGNGSGGESIFGKKFKDERAGLMRKHNCKGVLSMGNSGKNSNTSQFFFTFQATPQCDGKHAIFGRVISGFEVSNTS
jgi:cyclophilin family peptidyl-prolyl cis-trans isomerase